MGSTTFSGPLTITNGPLTVGGVIVSTTDVGYIDGITPGTVAVDKAIVPTTGKVIDTIDITTLKIGGTTITSTGTELNYVDVTAGTSAASKAIVLDSNSKINAIDITALTLNGTAVGATAAEINKRCDDSAMVDVRTGAGAISTTVAETAIVSTGADALTLAAATVPGLIKTIAMRTDGGDATLASTNILGQSAGSTSITFNDVGDTLVLMSCAETGKWLVLKEVGVTAA
jgi:hypothetical protein